MPRVNYLFFLTDQYGQGVNGATVSVVPRNPATPCAIYQAETGTSTVATPLLTTNQGRTSFWLDDDTAYNVTFSGAGINTFTHYFDAVSAQRGRALELQMDSIVASLTTPVVYEAGTPIYGYAYLGDVGPSLEPGLSLSGDTRIYRTSANTLQLPGTVKFGDDTNQTTAFQGYATPSVTATPLPGYQIDYAKRADYATPLIGVQVDYAKRAEYATPVGIASGAVAYLNRDQSFTGIANFTTPLIFSGAATLASNAGSNNLIAGNGFFAVANIRSVFGASTQTSIGALGPAGVAGLSFGLNQDAVVYRDNVGVVRTTGKFIADGTIGIGTSTPLFIGGYVPLHIHHPTSGSIAAYISSNTQALTDSVYIAFQNNRAIMGWDAGISGFRISSSDTNKPIWFNCAAASPVPYMVITGAGDIGIGTSTPTARLDVPGTIRTATPIKLTGNATLALLVHENTNNSISSAANYFSFFKTGNSAGNIRAGGLLLGSTFGTLPGSGSVGQAQIQGEVSIGATPVSGINFNVLGKSSLWTATPAKDPALELVGLLTATPGIRFSDTNTQTIAFQGYATPLPGGSIDFVARAGYATPVGVPVASLAYINQNQTYTGLSSYSTPINITSAGAFPSLNVAGLITATPGVRFPDGTVQVTAFTTGGAFQGYATPINTWSYTTPINVNANTTYTITHNLNSRAVTVQFYDTLNFEAVDPYVQRDTVNTLRVKFSQATPISTFQVVVKA